MPVEQINIDKFIDLSKSFPVFDVRSPSEFSHARFPSAISLPLFSDEERKVVGTAYVQQNRQTAVTIGLSYFSERMKNVFDEVKQFLKDKKYDNILLIYCWRGGMRSGAMAWLLSLYGYKVYTLKGGYKSFRRWTISQFEKDYKLNIVGGFTGSGKTNIIKELRKEGEKVIDLESLASHKGSAFGALGEVPQPTSEMFENLLALELYQLFLPQKDETNGDAYTKNNSANIWIEDESMHIGSVGIPKIFWNKMRQSQLFFLDIPFGERLKNIIKEYGKFDKEDLQQCILKTQKRLGGLETKNAIRFLREDQLGECFTILLRYYDKLYNASLNNRENLPLLLNKIPCNSVDINNTRKILKYSSGAFI